VLVIHDLQSLGPLETQAALDFARAGGGLLLAPGRRADASAWNAALLPGLGAGELALALGLGGSGHDLRENVRLAQDENLVGSDLDLGAAVLRKDDLVADRDVERDQFTRRLGTGAGANREHATALRLLLGRVRQDDPAERHFLFLEDLDDEPIA